VGVDEALEIAAGLVVTFGVKSDRGDIALAAGLVIMKCTLLSKIARRCSSTPGSSVGTRRFKR
jgi:hypothetical protein